MTDEPITLQLHLTPPAPPDELLEAIDQLANGLGAPEADRPLIAATIQTIWAGACKATVVEVTALLVEHGLPVYLSYPDDAAVS